MEEKANDVLTVFQVPVCLQKASCQVPGSSDPRSTLQIPKFPKDHFQVSEEAHRLCEGVQASGFLICQVLKI